MEEKFLFLIKELYAGMKKYFNNSNISGQSYGDWKVVKKYFSEEELQIIIYRSGFEFNFLFPYNSKTETNILLRMDRFQSPVFFDSYISCFANQLDINHKNTIKDERTIGLEQLESFVYKYFLKNAEEEIK